MKTRPIIFNTQMVRSVMDGAKTQTRRILKFKTFGFGKDGAPASIYMDGSGKGWVAWMTQNVSAEYTAKIYPGEVGFKCPMGEIGSIIYVRETWAELINGHNERYFAYKADGIPNKSDVGDWNWRPSIHMPKAAARIFLRITDIKVERLQDISEEDAVAEGVQQDVPVEKNFQIKKRYRHYSDPTIHHCEDAKSSFRSLWRSIYGTESWESNPWVWSISFTRVDKPENF